MPSRLDFPAFVNELSRPIPFRFEVKTLVGGRVIGDTKGDTLADKWRRVRDNVRDGLVPV